MMDPLEWMITLGNLNLAIWLNQTLGWIYTIFKMVIYLGIATLIFRKFYRLWRYNYNVIFTITGPEKTLTEINDRGAIFEQKGKTIFRCLKHGIMSFVPERKEITPLSNSKFFWQPIGTIRLLKYGSSNYSIVPIDTTLDREKLKHVPMESDIAAAMETADQIHAKYSQKPLWKDLAPILISFVPALIIAVLLLMSAGSYKASVEAQANAAIVLAKASDRLATCNVEQAPVSSTQPTVQDTPQPVKPKDNTPIDKYIPW